MSSTATSEAQPAPSRAQEPYRDMLAPALERFAGTELVSDDGQRLTGDQIRGRVHQLADRLRAAGCGPETLVALRFHPGVDAIVAILAVQMAGGAYLPLDPRHGDNRIANIVATTTPDLVMDPSGITVRNGSPASEPTQGLDDLAYVISTSGSTGSPKAAMIEQRGLSVHTRAMIDLLDLGPEDVVLQTAPPSFDIAVWQCTTPIIAGARTHVASDRQRLDPRALWQVLIDEKVTVTQLVPSMIRVMLDVAPPASALSLRHVISTGEALDPELVHRWFATFPDLPLINLYGPAECSDDVTVHVLHQAPDDDGPIPIGVAFAGARLRILDQEGRQVPAGVTGELQVCGDVVGRGYRNDPERTAVSFSAVELDGRIVRAYATGDLVYEDPAGLLRFVGRRDFQVKVRGNRVELGEIEHILSGADGVRTCVVTQMRDGTDRLVADVETEGPIDRMALRNRAADSLPSYMVPSAFVVHDRLPLNVNGKIDRDALPEPGRHDLVASAAEGRSPSTPTEQLLADNWSALLDLDQVPVDADFFDLGGTSLLAVVSIDQLSRTLGFELATSTLISGGTIERIAAAIDAADGSGDGPAGALGADRMGVVQLQHGAAGTPLFLYPGEAASGLGMVDLGRSIEPGRSVYVFEPARPVPGEPAPSMAELARRCRAAIDAVEPARPIHVGGFCMGGDVAWEIAHQRAQDGKTTATVLLLQTERDGVYPSWPRNVGRVRRLGAKLWQRLRFEIATARVLGPAQRRSHIRHLVIGKIVAKFTMVFEAWLHSSGLASRVGIRPSLRLRQELWARVDRAAYDGWVPAPLDCPVVVVRAGEQPPLIEADPTLGWSSTGTPDLASRVVPGFHWSILHHPSVEHLSRIVSDELTRNDP